MLIATNNPATTLEALENRIIGVQTGSTSQMIVNARRGFTAHPHESVDEALGGLIAGTIGAILCDVHIARHYANDPAYKGKIKVASFSLTDKPESYAFAVRKGNKKLLALLNSGITAVKRSGKDKEFREKWFSYGAASH